MSSLEGLLLWGILSKETYLSVWILLFTKSKHGTSPDLSCHLVRSQAVLPGWRHPGYVQCRSFQRAFAALITYERRSFSSPELFLQLFSAAWTTINMWVENHWTEVIKWLLVSWSSLYMVEGPCISVSQGVLFLSILLPFNAFKLCLLLSLLNWLLKRLLLPCLCHPEAIVKCLLFLASGHGMGRGQVG